jgi:hypothetical protein
VEPKHRSLRGPLTSHTGLCSHTHATGAGIAGALLLRGLRRLPLVRVEGRSVVAAPVTFPTALEGLEVLYC